MIDAVIHALIHYAVCHNLLDPEDRIWASNRLLEILQLDSLKQAPALDAPLPALLGALVEDAVKRGCCADDQAARDLLDT